MTWIPVSLVKVSSVSFSMSTICGLPTISTLMESPSPAALAAPSSAGAGTADIARAATTGNASARVALFLVFFTTATSDSVPGRGPAWTDVLRADVLGRMTWGPSTANLCASPALRPACSILQRLEVRDLRGQKLETPNLVCSPTKTFRRARAGSWLFTRPRVRVVRPCSPRDPVGAEVGQVDDQLAEHLGGPVVHGRHRPAAQPPAEQHGDRRRLGERRGREQGRSDHGEPDLRRGALRDELRGDPSSM